MFCYRDYLRQNYFFRLTILFGCASRLFGRWGKCTGCLLVIPAFIMVIIIEKFDPQPNSICNVIFCHTCPHHGDNHCKIRHTTQPICNVQICYICRHRGDYHCKNLIEALRPLCLNVTDEQTRRFQQWDKYKYTDSFQKVMKVGEHVWHLGCFSCQLCTHRFSTKDINQHQQQKITKD